MPEQKCAVCGTTVVTKYSGAGLLFFCKDCGGSKVDDVIRGKREEARRDFPLDPRDPDPRETES